MKTKLLALMLLAGTSMFARSHFGFSVGFGYAAPAPVVVYSAPPAPVYSYYTPAYPSYLGPGYTWVGGYYYPVGPRWSYRTGYWARRPYVGARWVAPRYYGGRYYAGYWRR